MRKLDVGASLYSSIELEERRRLRSGLLAGAVVMTMGIALAVALAMARPLGVYHGSADRFAFLVLVGASVFLTLIGLVLCVAHAVWTRSITSLRWPEPPQPPRPPEDTPPTEPTE